MTASRRKNRTIQRRTEDNGRSRNRGRDADSTQKAMTAAAATTAARKPSIREHRYMSNRRDGGRTQRRPGDHHVPGT